MIDYKKLFVIDRPRNNLNLGQVDAAVVDKYNKAPVRLNSKSQLRAFAKCKDNYGSKVGGGVISVPGYIERKRGAHEESLTHNISQPWHSQDSDSDRGKDGTTKALRDMAERRFDREEFLKCIEETGGKLTYRLQMEEGQIGCPVLAWCFGDRPHLAIVGIHNGCDGNIVNYCTFFGHIEGLFGLFGKDRVNKFFGPVQVNYIEIAYLDQH